MTESRPGSPALPAARGVPLLIVAELPADVFAWADGLRRTHYPPERNRLAAHVTLFHGLPPSAAPPVVAALASLSRQPPPAARITGLMDLGEGTALAIESPAMVGLHAELAESLHGLIQQRDARPLRLHITIQDKVPAREARALQAELTHTLEPRSFHFRGFGIYGWTGDLWLRTKVFPFRGMN